MLLSMETMVDRIQLALNKAGIKWSTAAVKIGLSAQAASNWKKGKIGKDTLEKLAELLEVDVGWLLTGGESQKSEYNDQADTSESNVSPLETPLHAIPLLDYVQAGLFHEVGYDGINPLGTSWTTYESARPECVFSLKVEGNSMSPEFQPGDEIVVDSSLEARPGALVIAQEVQHGQARTTFKKYRVIGVNEFGVDVIELVPLNPDFPTLNSNQIDISIIGVVVAHNRRFKY